MRLDRNTCVLSYIGVMTKYITIFAENRGKYLRSESGDIFVLERYWDVQDGKYRRGWWILSRTQNDSFQIIRFFEIN